MNETAIAFSTSEGTTQTVTSSLGEVVRKRTGQDRTGKEWCVLNREKRIDEKDSAFANLQCTHRTSTSEKVRRVLHRHLPSCSPTSRAHGQA